MGGPELGQSLTARFPEAPRRDPGGRSSRSRTEASCFLVTVVAPFIGTTAGVAGSKCSSDPPGLRKPDPAGAHYHRAKVTVVVELTQASQGLPACLVSWNF